MANTGTVSTPSSTSVFSGQTTFDTAVVTGNAGGPAPTGTVTFYLCSNTTTGCNPASGTQLGGPVTLTADTDPSKADASSANISPAPSPGNYCFAAVYSGDSNYNGSSDGTVSECFVVAT